MQRILIMLVILLLLGGGSYWLWEQNRDTKTSLAGEDREFAVRDTTAIGKIFLVDRFDNQVTLTRQGPDWIADGTYLVRQDAIKNLLRAVSSVEMKYKPPQAAISNILKSLSTEGIKVEVYNRQNRLMKAYYVGGATNDERGTYMMLDGYDQPYITHIPGFVGNLRFRYNLKGDDWRDRFIFTAPVNSIKKVSVDYPKQKNLSFVIEQENGRFSLRPFYATTPPLPGEPTQGRIEQYLIGFKHVGTAGFVNHLTTKDSLQAQTPFVDITVEHTDGKVEQALLLPEYNKPGYDTKTKTFVTPSESVSSYYVTNREGDLLQAQHRQVQQLLWAYDYFFPEK